MAGHFDAVDKDAGAVGGRTKTDHDIAAVPFAGNKEISLIPEIAAIFTAVFVGKQVAEGRGDRHQNGGGQTVGPVGPNTGAFRIKLELPHAVQADDTAGSRGNRVQK